MTHICFKYVNYIGNISLLRNIKNIFKLAWLHLITIDGLAKAAVLAFTSMFALVPLVVLSITILGMLPGFAKLSYEFEMFLLSHLASVEVATITATLKGFVQQAQQLSLLGVCFLFISSLCLFLEAQSSFDKVWQVQQKRTGVMNIIFYTIVLVMFPIVCSFAILLSHAIPWLQLILQVDSFIWAFILGVLLLFLIYKLLPSCKVTVIAAALGSLCANILGLIFKYLFILYFQYFTSYAILYGTMAAVPIFMLWLYFSWFIVLFGAAVCFIYDKKQ